MNFVNGRLPKQFSMPVESILEIKSQSIAGANNLPKANRMYPYLCIFAKIKNIYVCWGSIIVQDWFHPYKDYVLSTKLWVILLRMCKQG